MGASESLKDQERRYSFFVSKKRGKNLVRRTKKICFPLGFFKQGKTQKVKLSK